MRFAQQLQAGNVLISTVVLLLTGEWLAKSRFIVLKNDVNLAQKLKQQGYAHSIVEMALMIHERTFRLVHSQ